MTSSELNEKKKALVVSKKNNYTEMRAKQGMRCKEQQPCISFSQCNARYNLLKFSKTKSQKTANFLKLKFEIIQSQDLASLEKCKDSSIQSIPCEPAGINYGLMANKLDYWKYTNSNWPFLFLFSFVFFFLFLRFSILYEFQRLLFCVQCHSSIPNQCQG